jgi:hypothetical protein
VIRRRKSGDPRAPWWRRDVAALGRMEAGLRTLYPEISISRFKNRLVYELDLEIETYETRRIRIVFNAGEPAAFVNVFADGPTESPHRYGKDRLCLWYPKDPPELRWLPDHRLVGLIEVARRHLFREAWWRQTGGEDGGEWLGPEIHPGEQDEDAGNSSGGA